MSINNDLTLIDRLDNNLSDAKAAQVDTEIAGDHATAADWAFLQLAVDTISLGAIRDRVAAVRAVTAKEAAPVVKMERKEGAVARGVFKTTLRIAAVAVVLLCASVAYKYMTVDSVSLYNNAFSEYELGTSRGDEAGDRMDDTYRDRNWPAVLDAFSKQTVKTNKSYFLAGMAEMELKKYPAAVGHFEQVIAANARTKENYFQAESEYYLALAYLMNNQPAKGLGMIRRIKADLYHPYYPLAARISSADLKIVELKK